MSCYCYAKAIYLDSLHQYEMAYTLLQRTLDFYLQSMALDANLIGITNSGMRFQVSGYYEMSVGIFALEKCLIEFNKLESNSSRREFISWLNNTRNTLISTHGVFSIKEAEVKDAIEKMKKTIELIEGSKRWEMSSKKFTFSSNFNYNHLFDLEPSIELYFQ